MFGMNSYSQEKAHSTLSGQSRGRVRPSLFRLVWCSIFLIVLVDFRWGNAEEGGEAQFDRLLVALKDSDPSVRCSAAEALVKLQDTRGWEFLIASLKGPSLERIHAARALGRLGDPRAVEPLITALVTSGYGTREAIVKVLDSMNEPMGSIVNRSLSGDEFAMSELSKSRDRRAFEAFAKALKGSDSSLRHPAARALGRLGDPRAVDLLIPELTDSESGIRASVAESLGLLGDPAAVEPLLNLLADSDLKIRQSAALALGEIKDTRAVQDLIKILGTPDVVFRTQLAKALSEMGEPVGMQIHRSFSGDREALKELSASNDIRPLESFIQAALDPNRVFRKSAVATFTSLPANAPFSTALALAAGRWDREERRGAGRLLMASPAPFSNQFIVQCAQAIVAPGSLALAGMLLLVVSLGLAWGWYKGFGVSYWWLAVGIPVLWTLGNGWVFVFLPMGLGGAYWWRKHVRWIPGWAGWIGLGSLLVSLVLYGHFLFAGVGGWVLMVVSLTPLWLAVLGGLIQGAICWPAAAERMGGLVCKVDFCRFEPKIHTGAHCWSGGAYYHAAGWDGDLTAACACRICGQQDRKYSGIETVVAVLDNQKHWQDKQSGSELRVNWPVRRKPFDFDAVEVVRATDEEVEAFTNQMRFESDERIASRLLTMGCRVDPGCGLKDGTMRLLGLVFGEVKRAGEGQRG